MLQFLKTAQNSKILQQIRNEVYPDMVHAIGNIKIEGIENVGDVTMEDMINPTAGTKGKGTKTTN